MKLLEALANLRGALGDGVDFLTTVGQAAGAPGAVAIAVDAIEAVDAGDFVIIGTGTTAEGRCITALTPATEDATTGPGKASLGAPLANAHDAGEGVYAVGGQLTTLGGTAAVAGASKVHAADVGAVAAGQRIILGTGAQAEARVVVTKSGSTGAGTLQLDAPLEYDHDGATVIAAVGARACSVGQVAAFAGATRLPVEELADVARGQYILVGTGANAEGHYVATRSGVSGRGYVTVTPPLVHDVPTDTVVMAALATDDAYATALARAIEHYSTLRPRTLPYPDGGLALVKDQASYTLPADFIQPEPTSFQAALGLPVSQAGAGSLHALVFVIGQRFAATPYGMETTFGEVGMGGFVLPYSGLPTLLGNDLPAAPPQTFTFQKASPPTLLVQPAPAADRLLAFNYHGLHAMPTVDADASVPAQDVGYVIQYAIYLRALALATGAATVMKYKLENEEVDRSKAPAAYLAIANAAKQEFDTNIRAIGQLVQG